MDQRPGPSLFDLASMGATTALFVGGGVGIGYWVDSAAKVGVVAVFVGLALGLGAAFAAMYVKIKKYL